MRRMVIEALACLAAVAVIAYVVACTTDDLVEAGTGETLQQTLDRECRERGLICARVFEFAQAADNELGHVEMCVREEDLPLAESLFGDSMWTSRDGFQRYYVLGIEPMCVWCAGFGCNSLSGCFGCEVTP